MMVVVVTVVVDVSVAIVVAIAVVDADAVVDILTFYVFNSLFYTITIVYLASFANSKMFVVPMMMCYCC